MSVVLKRLEAMESRVAKLETTNKQVLEENKLLRMKVAGFERQVKHLTGLNEVVSTIKIDLAKINSCFDALEFGLGEEVVGGVYDSSRGIPPVAKASGGKSGTGCPVSQASPKPPVDGTWHQMCRKRNEGTKRMVAEEVAKTMGRLSRCTRAVITGLPFHKDKPDEEVVSEFLLKHDVTTPFKIFKKVKCRLVPAVTSIIVIDVGSVEERDQLFRKIKRKLRDTTIYVNEDKTPEDLREEYMLRQEARDKNKNLPAEDRGKIRYAVRSRQVVDLGPAKFPNSTSSHVSSSGRSSLGVGLGLGPADSSL
jgi:hypothetical protein